ncbi:MAG: hypothetical protein WC731_03245 [Candidatus Omnitrophota bacterium]|jgi:hypothetical protein
MIKTFLTIIFTAAFLICHFQPYPASGNFAALAQTQGVKISEVKMVNGTPRLFINSEEIDTGAVNIYYLPDMGVSVEGKNEVPRYASEKWLTNTKDLIDQALSNHARLILLNLWWSDLDKSVIRANSISAYLDFNNLDKIFDYAGKQGAYIIPVFVFFPFIPDWWLKENNFPPYNKAKICDFCETDSYGNVYNNPSMNSDKVQRDWGSFLEGVIKHYKNHPALAGWMVGVGATGEDGYGPNYIYLRGFGNATEKIENRPLMFTDYSPYFERKFKEWLKEKYGSEAGLQSAREDKSITFDYFKIPKPIEMIKGGKQVPVFPDPTDIFALAAGKNSLDNLTVKGLDFYNFRNYMRRLDRRYYSDLFRKNDPNHILIFSASSEDFLSEESLADGIGFSLAGSIDAEANNLFYYLALDIVKKAASHKKLAFISREHVCDGELRSRIGQCETSEQLRFTETLGKSVKCAGGIFAYTAAPYDESSFANGSWVPPVWFSGEIMAVAKKINEYVPSQGCACSFTREVYSNSGCDTINAAGNCGLLSKFYGSCCGGMITEAKFNNPVDTTGKCGDGICDSFERECGKCPADCK